MTIGNDPTGKQKIVDDIDGLDTKIDVIDGYHDIPTADSAANILIRDIVGNKTDTVSGDSLMALIKHILAEVVEVEKHIHNREIWFGNGAVEDSLTPYTLVSGNNAFGTEVLILDVGDTPVISGMTKFDPHQLEVVSADTNSEYFIRIIWGTGTVGDAETAKQYTTVPVTPSGVGSNISGAPVEVISKRLNSGVDKVWIKIKNASNLAELEVQVGIHEYLV